LLGWTQETLADKARIALTALKRLESANGLGVYETTRDQVRRALESAGIVFLSTDRGQGVLLVDDRGNNPNRSKPSR
jgi:hypothetical protein